MTTRPRTKGLGATPYDVVIVGGGVIGAAAADRLAGEGRRVAVLERGPFAREASWAAPGILHPVHPWKYKDPLPAIFKRAMRDHPALVADLLDRTGIDAELRAVGLVIHGDAAERVAAWWGGETRWEMRPDGAIFLPDACSIRPPRFTRALLEGARRRGADLFDHTEVLEVAPHRVRTAGRTFEAAHVVLAAGPWSGRLRPEAPTKPVRGQILLYRGTTEHMQIFAGGEYAVPRPDGLVLFGSTLEDAGFAPRPTRDAVTRLQKRAWELCGLAESDLLAAWAGLRPATPSDLPYICARDGLIYATGHYRAGVILAPLTARCIGDLVAGSEPEFEFPIPA